MKMIVALCAILGSSHAGAVVTVNGNITNFPITNSTFLPIGLGSLSGITLDGFELDDREINSFTVGILGAGASSYSLNSSSLSSNYTVTETSAGSGVFASADPALFDELESASGPGAPQISFSLTGAGTEGVTQFTEVNVGQIPEPSTALLGALGCFGLLRRRR